MSETSSEESSELAWQGRMPNRLDSSSTLEQRYLNEKQGTTAKTTPPFQRAQMLRGGPPSVDGSACGSVVNRRRGNDWLLDRAATWNRPSDKGDDSDPGMSPRRDRFLVTALETKKRRGTLKLAWMMSSEAGASWCCTSSVFSSRANKYKTDSLMLYPTFCVRGSFPQGLI